MNTPDPKRVMVFVCVMTIIAVVICGVRYRLEQHHLAVVAEQKHLAVVAQERRKMENEAAAQRAIREAVERHAQYVARYVYPGFTRKPGREAFAVAVASENETLDSTVAAALVSRFKNEPVEIVSSFFKAAFVSDGLFQEAFNGSGAPFDKLDLTNSLGFSHAVEIQPNDSISATVKFSPFDGRSRATTGVCSLQIEFLLGHNFGSVSPIVSVKNLVTKIEAD
jgi:hypothetical protein